MLTKDQLRAINADIDAALAAVANKHGLVSLRTKGTTFDPTGSFTVKVDGMLKGGKTRESSRYEQMLKFRKDLPPLGAQVTLAGRTVEVTGANSTGSKVIARELSTNKEWLYPVDALAIALARSAQKGSA